jgi:argininosuccinate lyase
MSRGRFRAGLDPEALRYSSSLPIDRKLTGEDITGSLAHLEMLGARHIIPARSVRRIRKTLERIGSRLSRGTVNLPASGRLAGEDIHMAIERLLIRELGEEGGLLHTARSRNDQVALDERLYLRNAVTGITGEIRGVQRLLVHTAERHKDVLMPGYTHLQWAQPVLLAHHLLAYVAMLDRDAGRFVDCLRRASVSPLGSGALAGTPFPVDRRRVARRLGLAGVQVNSMDAVSDRDALLEFLSASAIAMMHLSRFAEELVLWSSREWSFVEIGEKFTTGSSIMPQKRNPDMAELVRARTGRVYGDLVALLTVMKALPLAYNRDMQEDKEPLFDAAETLTASLHIMGSMIPSLRFRRERFVREMATDPILATELADYLARKGIPFRAAHAVVGSVVRRSLESGIPLTALPLSAYRKFSPAFDTDLYAVLSPEFSVRAKRSEGSTSPREVARQIRMWKGRLGRGRAGRRRDSRTTRPA